jgi:hypothetical protein
MMLYNYTMTSVIHNNGKGKKTKNNKAPFGRHQTNRGPVGIRAGSEKTKTDHSGRVVSIQGSIGLSPYEKNYGRE